MRYRTIDIRLLGDEKFRRLTPLQPSGQALFIYLLITPHSSSIPGLFRAGEAAMAEELRWDIESFRKCMAEIINLGIVHVDFDARVIHIPNALKYNKPRSVSVIKSWITYWDEIPECSLKLLAYENMKIVLEAMGTEFLKAFITSCKRPKLLDLKTRNPEKVLDIKTSDSENTLKTDLQEQEQEQEQEKRISMSSCEQVDVDGLADVIANDVMQRSAKPKPPPALTTQSRLLKQQATEILEFLNYRANRQYRPVDTNLKLIIARLKSGATPLQCRQIIIRKHREWKDDHKMVEYLRPATLFNATKFEQYMGELVVQYNTEVNHEG